MSSFDPPSSSESGRPRRQSQTEPATQRQSIAHAAPSYPAPPPPASALRQQSSASAVSAMSPAATTSGHRDSTNSQARQQHVLFVHGTYSETAEERWAAPGQPFPEAMLEHFGTESYDAFGWSGGATEAARQTAAEALLEKIRETKASMPDHDINVVAHSHGGNVLARTLKMMDGDESIASAMLLGTPQFRKQGPLGGNPRNTMWNADAQNHVRGDIYNIYSRHDYIQTKGAGARNRTNWSATTGEGFNSFVHSGRTVFPEDGNESRVKNINATNVVSTGPAASHQSFHTGPVFSAISRGIKSGNYTTGSKRKSLTIPPER